MGLQSSDLILVERSNTLYKETYGNKANIDATDLVVVERSNTIYKCTYSDWAGTSGSGSGGSGTHGWSSSNTTYSFTLIKQPLGVGTGDVTNAYNVFSQSMSVTGGDGTATGNLYIGVRMRGTTTYYHDFCVAAIQILQSSGTSFRTDSTYSSGYDWNGHRALNSSNATQGFYNWRTSNGTYSYTADPSTHTYTTITGPTNARWSQSSSTGSSYTGAADGIYQSTGYSGGGGTIIPASGTVSQVSNTSFIYTESSGGGYTVGTSSFWLKSPEITVHNNDILRILYLGVGGSTTSDGLGSFNTDTIWFRFK